MARPRFDWFPVKGCCCRQVSYRLSLCASAKPLRLLFIFVVTEAARCVYPPMLPFEQHCCLSCVTTTNNKIPHRVSYGKRWRAGRKDDDVAAVPSGGRLPAADRGNPMATAKGLRDVFYRMGFNDRDIVALSGAHALGRCAE